MAAISDVGIANLALQLLGAAKITSFSDNSRNARSCNICYAFLRDLELEAHPWTFATKRVVLAPDTAAPAFFYTYQFSLPSDYLRLLPFATPLQDYKLEGSKILTNTGVTYNLRYTARITDPTQFHTQFAYAVAARMGAHMCEEITQSNEKKKDAAQAYKDAISAARRKNAFEKLPDSSPPDSWQLAGEIGWWNQGRPILDNDIEWGIDD